VREVSGEAVGSGLAEEGVEGAKMALGTTGRASVEGALTRKS
jgi:hypothetical protein